MTARRPARLGRALAILLALMCVGVVADDLGDAVARVRELRADRDAARAEGEVAYATAVWQAHVEHEERVAATEARLRQKHGVDDGVYAEGLPAYNAAWKPLLADLERRRDTALSAAETARSEARDAAELTRAIDELESATYAVEVPARVGSYRHEDGSFALALSGVGWPVPADASVAVPAEQTAAARATFGAVTVDYGIDAGEVVRRAMWIGRDGKGDRYRVRPAVWTRAHRLAGHAGPVTGAALVEGHRAVTAGQDGRLLVWNVLDPAEPPREIEAHSHPIEFLAHTEGAIRVASATAHEVKLWDAFTLELSQTIDPGAAMRREPAPPQEPNPSAPAENLSVRHFDRTVSAIAVSSHTPLMAFAVHGPGNMVVIWDGSARATAALIDIGESITESLAFSGRGSVLAAGLRDGRVLLWDLRRSVSGTKPGALRRMEVPPLLDGESEADNRLRILRLNVAVSPTLRSEIAAHRKPVLALAFTPKARTLVTGSADRTAVAWDAPSGARLQTFAKGHRGAVTSVAIHRKGVRVITGCRDGRARLWEMATGERVRAYLGHEGAVRAVAVGGRLLTASEDGSARLWRPGTGEEVAALLGHVSPARLVGISGDGRRALTRSRAGELALWSATTGSKVWGLPPGSNDGALALSSDGRLVASESVSEAAAVDRVVRVWDTVQGGGPVGSFPSMRRDRIRVRFVDGDSRLLVTPSSAMWPVLREVENLGETSPVLPAAAPGPGATAGYGRRVSGDGRVVAARVGTDEIAVWHAPDEGAPTTWRLPRGTPALSAANYDGSRLLAYEPLGRVHVWDARTGELFGELAAATDRTCALAFSHDGEILVTASNAPLPGKNGRVGAARASPVAVKLWSTETGQEIRSLPSPSDWVTTTAFSGDDARVAIGAGDSVRVYDVATGAEVATLGPYESPVARASMSHDGATVVISTRSGVLDVWRPVPAFETMPAAGSR